MMAVPFMETLYSHIVADFSNKLDALVWAVHTYFVHYGLKCVGISDTKVEDCSTASESLPTEWRSQSPNIYTLQYVKTSDNSQYVVKVLSVGEQIIINVLRLADNNIATIQIDVNDVVSDDFGRFNTAFINLDVFREQLESGLSTMGWFPSKDARPGDGMPSEQQQKAGRSRYDARPGQPQAPNVHGQPQPNPLDIGSSDLDPFGFRPGGGAAGVFPGGGGGGMYMRLPRPSPAIDPSTGLPERLPPGAVPPGARFDPFGPPGTGPGPGTGPDYMRPPPDDDYYM